MLGERQRVRRAYVLHLIRTVQRLGASDLRQCVNDPHC